MSKVDVCPGPSTSSPSRFLFPFALTKLKVREWPTNWGHLFYYLLYVPNYFSPLFVLFFPSHRLCSVIVVLPLVFPFVVEGAVFNNVKSNG